MTLNDFITEKVTSLRHPGAQMIDLNGVEYMPISIDQFRSALRECAEKTVEATTPQLDDMLDEERLETAQRAWLGTNDQLHA